MTRLALILALALAGCTSFEDLTERHVTGPMDLPADPGSAAADSLFTPQRGKHAKP